MNLSRLSLRYPITATMVLVSIALIGAISTPRLPLAFLPEVDFPGLEIVIPYPNSLPTQVEEEITRPAEEALATMSRVRRITSTSSANASNISVQFDWGVDVEPLRAEAREKLDRIRDQLPVDVEHIQVNSFRSSDIPVLECRISANSDLSHSYELLDRHVADPLRRVPGVAKVELFGVDRPEVQVNFHLDALERHAINANTVIARLDAANQSVGAGQLRSDTESRPVRVVNEFHSLDDFRSFPITDRGLTLGDVATIAYREPELDYGRHLDRSRAIGLNVIKESGANTVDVVRRARRVLDGFPRDPELRGIQVLTFQDQAEEITNSLRGLLEAGVIGAILAVIVLFLFLRNVTSTLVVATAIPFSLVAACALLYFTGSSLNILSMMGLMLAVGMLVDNAVVMLEAIYRHRQKGMGQLRAALVGSREVLPAVVCATGTSIIVFLPLVLSGRTEITTWIGEIGRTIIFTLSCSLLLSLTAIPLAMGRALRVTPGREARWLTWLASRYRRTLEWTLAHRPATLAIAFGVVLSAVAAFIPVDKSTFSAAQVQSVEMSWQFADNLNYREVERYVRHLEDWIEARKDTLHAKSTYSFFTHNFAFTRIYLAKGYADEEGAKAMRDILRAKMPPLPGVTITLEGQDGQNTGSAQMGVNVFGDPGPRLDDLADEVRRRLSLVPGLSDVHVDRGKGSEELTVAVRRDEAMEHGLSTSDVADAVALFFRGRPLARFRGPDGEVEVVARLAEEDRQSLERFRTITLAGRDGQIVPLAAVADFRQSTTPTDITRQQRKSVASVSANYDSKQSGRLREAVRREMNGMSFPAGYTWSFGRAFEEENATQKEMLVNLLLALMLVYLVMAALFESLLHPFAIMLALPFAFVGIAWVCLLSGSPFNLMSQIGLLILIGIVVNNGIVLIYRVHQQRESGVSRQDAVLGAARDRLRPILMTTLTTTLGLMPLAVGQNRVGDVMYFPLARTVIGGLAASTALTLLLVPCLYTLLEDGAHMVARVWRTGPAATPAEATRLASAPDAR